MLAYILWALQGFLPLLWLTIMTLQGMVSFWKIVVGGWITELTLSKSLFAKPKALIAILLTPYFYCTSYKKLLVSYSYFFCTDCVAGDTTLSNWYRSCYGFAKKSSYWGWTNSEGKAGSSKNPHGFGICCSYRNTHAFASESFLYLYFYFLNK